MKCVICKHYLDGETTRQLLSKAEEIAGNGVEVDIRKFADAA